MAVEGRRRRVHREVQSNKVRRVEKEDEVIESSDGASSGAETDVDEGENAKGLNLNLSVEEARLLLAQEYLDRMGVTANELEVQALSEVLALDGTKAKQKDIYKISSSLRIGKPICYAARRHLATSLAVLPGDECVVTGGKDGKVYQWNVETGSRTALKVSTNAVTSLAEGMNGRLLVTGGAEKDSLRLWDTRMNGRVCVDTLKGHRQGVSALSVQGDYVLSGSYDRTVKVWSLMGRQCVHTLFGHTAAVTGLHSLSKDSLLSAGQDCTIRYWNIEENKHVLFHDPLAGGAVDAVALLPSRRSFLSGGQDGQVKLWAVSKKKPVVERPTMRSGWVASMCTIPRSDVAFSASNTGLVETWVVASDNLQKTGHIESVVSGGAGRAGCSRNFFALQEGYVNAMQVSPSGAFLFGATSREPRLGRWNVDKTAKGVGLLIVPLEHAFVDQLLGERRLQNALT